MTTYSAAIGTIEDPVSVPLTTTSVTDIYAMAAGRPEMVTIIGVILANEGASPRLCSIWWTENSTDYLLWRGSVAAASTETDVVKHPIRLYAKSTARKIKAQAAAANEVTVTLIIATNNPQTAKA